MTIEGITSWVEHEGILLTNQVLVEAYLNALQKRYRQCMNPYPHSLQEAAERASTHEMLQAKFHYASQIQAISNRPSVSLLDDITALADSTALTVSESAKVLLNTINALS